MDPAPPGDGRPGGGDRLRTPRAAAAPAELRRAAGRARPRPILLNRRAATRPTITGVERWTLEVIARLPALAPGRYLVAEPPAGARRRLPAHAWEQTALPARASRLRAALIFSPANLAPLVWPRNVVVMHDAAALREPDAYSRAYRLWHRAAGLEAARRSRAVVTVSEFSRRELISVAGLDPARLIVIPGGVDERFVPAGGAPAPPRRRPYVLTIATADRRKNLAALTPVAAALRERGIDLAWAGDDRPYFTRTEAPDGLQPLGYVPEADLPGLYRGALAFVLPSRYEGFGLTCLEAMACGTPVVAADRAALPETCGDGALLVDPDDARALTATVLAAATDPVLRARLSEAGLRRARGFSWMRTAELVDALLTRLAGQNPGPGPGPRSKPGPGAGSGSGLTG